jgi:hypothetical protein
MSAPTPPAPDTPASDMPGRRNIADILCIGCQKGSTSWLHSILACHPDTHSFPDSDPVTSTDKEAHFWDWNHERGVEWYRDLLAPPYPALRTMDFTPEYAFLTDDQIAECKVLNPDAQVLYVLRDPLARAISALRMELLWNRGSGWDGVLSVGPDLRDFIERARLDLHGDYTANVARWRRAYPEMIVLNYEDLHADRPAQVAALMTQLGLDPGLITGEAAERMAGLMPLRIWQSEPFALDRRALMFLDGLSRGWRAATERELGLRFVEGASILAAAR